MHTICFDLRHFCILHGQVFVMKVVKETWQISSMVFAHTYAKSKIDTDRMCRKHKDVQIYFYFHFTGNGPSSNYFCLLLMPVNGHCLHFYSQFIAFGYISSYANSSVKLLSFAHSFTHDISLTLLTFLLMPVPEHC